MKDSTQLIEALLILDSTIAWFRGEPQRWCPKQSFDASTLLAGRASMFGIANRYIAEFPEGRRVFEQLTAKILAGQFEWGSLYVDRLNWERLPKTNFQSILEFLYHMDVALMAEIEEHIKKNAKDESTELGRHVVACRFFSSARRVNLTTKMVDFYTSNYRIQVFEMLWLFFNLRKSNKPGQSVDQTVSIVWKNWMKPIHPDLDPGVPAIPTFHIVPQELMDKVRNEMSLNLTDGMLYGIIHSVLKHSRGSK